MWFFCLNIINQGRSIFVCYAFNNTRELLSRTVKNPLATQQVQWNPIKRKATPWIDTKKMDKMYGPKRWHNLAFDFDYTKRNVGFSRDWEFCGGLTYNNKRKYVWRQKSFHSAHWQTGKYFNSFSWHKISISGPDVQVAGDLLTRWEESSEQMSNSHKYASPTDFRSHAGSRCRNWTQATQAPAQMSKYDFRLICLQTCICLPYPSIEPATRQRSVFCLICSGNTYILILPPRAEKTGGPWAKIPSGCF